MDQSGLLEYTVSLGKNLISPSVAMATLASFCTTLLEGAVRESVQ